MRIVLLPCLALLGSPAYAEDLTMPYQASSDSPHMQFTFHIKEIPDHGKRILGIDLLNLDTNQHVQQFDMPKNSPEEGEGYEASRIDQNIFEDVNFDGYLDLTLMEVFYPYVSAYRIWVYDPQTQRLKMQFSGMLNPYYDSKAKIVRSYEQCCYRSHSEDKEYRWNGDKLELTRVTTNRMITPQPKKSKPKKDCENPIWFDQKVEDVKKDETRILVSTGKTMDCQ